MPNTRSRHVTQAVPTYELVWNQAHQALKQAVRGLVARQEMTGLFVRLRECLERLPIAQNDFGLAICRLENAEHYNCSREPGAAAYELRLLNHLFIQESRCLENWQAKNLRR